MHGADQTVDKKPLTWVEARKKVVYNKPNPVKKIYCSSINLHGNRTLTRLKFHEQPKLAAASRFFCNPVNFNWLIRINQVNSHSAAAVTVIKT